MNNTDIIDHRLNMHWTYWIVGAILPLRDWDGAGKAWWHGMTVETAITLLVVMLGAMVQGLTGLGFALVSVPILVLFQDAKSVIVTTLILGLVLNVMILYQARKHITLKDAGPVTVGSVIGVPFGSYLLTILSPDLLKFAVAVLVMAFSVPLLMGYSRSFRHFQTASLVTGAVAGAMQSSTSMGSPPVVLLMANQGIPKESFRGMLVLRSAAASSLSVLALVPSGLLNQGIAYHVLLMAPALLLGFALGSRLLKRVPQEQFKRITIGLVTVTSLVSLVGMLLGSHPGT
jgi:uncharacterized protein